MGTIPKEEMTETFDQEDPLGYDDADSLLGPAIPSVTFPEIGAFVEGEILDIATGDQRDVDGAPRTFRDGSVRRQVIFTLQTKLHENDDDDGRRRLFVKGQMQKSFREAIAVAKVKGPRPGGKVKVTYHADGEKTNPALSAPKLFTVKYTPPKS